MSKYKFRHTGLVTLCKIGNALERDAIEWEKYSTAEYFWYQNIPYFQKKKMHAMVSFKNNKLYLYTEQK